MLRLRVAAVNDLKMVPLERAYVHWASTIWFTSFQSQCETMHANKRNMLMESIAVLFLVTRSDVYQIRRATSEPNEHVYGMVRTIRREFTVEQFVDIVNKIAIRMNAIFESGLATSRNRGKGYSATFNNFIETTKNAASSNSPPSGPVEVDLTQPAIKQLWDEVRHVINRVNEKMLPFLAKFGVCDGNGLSPFSVQIESPEQLMSMLTEYFKPPKRDPRDKEPGSSVSPEVEEDVDGNESDYDEEDFEVNEMTATMLEGFIEDLTEAESNNESLEDVTSPLEESIEGGSIDEDEVQFLGMVDCSKMFLEFKEMLDSGNSMSKIGSSVIRVMELASLGRLEKGSMSMDGRFKSLPGRWFNAKNPSLKSSDYIDGDGVQFIQRDSLITVKAKRGKTESIEYYRVLGIFSKHYNKWYLHWDEDKVAFVRNSKQYKILARMVEKSGRKFKEVELVAGGQWSPRCVYVLRYMSEIVSVESVLGTDSLSL